MKERSLVNNWISYLGFLLAIVFLFGETILIVLDMTRPIHNPYTGILIYIVGPSILVAALIAVPLGIVYEHIHRKRHGGESSRIVIDFSRGDHRKYAIIFVVVTVPFLLLSSLGTYQAYHVTESVEFCGTLCHQVMGPEHAAYQESPHARVACTQCHIGPGAGWFVKSKLAGAHQVYAVLTESYSMPIDTPIENLRPARDTCEQCHWPEKFTGNIERVRTHYADDDENTPYRVVLSLKIGGGHPEHGHLGGVHWHVNPSQKIEYIAADQDRLDIPYVKVTYDDGRIQEFRGPGHEELGDNLADDPRLREMDCLDCHNRPSHKFYPPKYAVDQAIDMGQIDPKLPNVKGIAAGLLEGAYETQDEALAAIDAGMHEALDSSVEETPELAPKLQQAIEQAKAIYRANLFPEHGVSWDKYPDHAGHFYFPGCYRCHNDIHEDGDGTVISNDCEVCHDIIGQAEGWDEVENMTIAKQPFLHPRDMEGVEEDANCADCHGAES